MLLPVTFYVYTVNHFFIKSNWLFFENYTNSIVYLNPIKILYVTFLHSLCSIIIRFVLKHHCFPHGCWLIILVIVIEIELHFCLTISKNHQIILYISILSPLYFRYEKIIVDISHYRKSPKLPYFKHEMDVSYVQ